MLMGAVALRLVLPEQVGGAQQGIGHLAGFHELEMAQRHGFASPKGQRGRDQILNGSGDDPGDNQGQRQAEDHEYAQARRHPLKPLLKLIGQGRLRTADQHRPPCHVRTPETDLGAHSLQVEPLGGALLGNGHQLQQGRRDDVLPDKLLR